MWITTALFVLATLTQGLTLKSFSSRRQYVVAVIAPLLILPHQDATQAAMLASDNNNGPFCVIGANGKTGTQCVQYCIKQKYPVRATSRSGTYQDMDKTQSSLLDAMICDVKDTSTITACIEGCRAVIFAASASKEGGSAADVDNVGLINVAKACIDKQIPHLVIVSSGSVSQPNSQVYKFLNLFGNIMDEKNKGETGVRSLYKQATGLTYTIIRPGGLTEEPPLGVSGLELNQGDEKSGRISRADVAALCVEATLHPSLTAATTFECYNANTAKSLQAVGLSNILKQTTDTSSLISGRERRGNSYENIFAGLDKDYSPAQVTALDTQ